MQAPPSPSPAEAVTVPPTAPEVPPALPVLYRDEAVVAVHKPSGLLVHRTGLDSGERWFAVQLLRDQLGGQHVYPVHRLDKATSGVLLFALSSADAAALGAQFSGQDPAHPVGKRYEAVVRGWPPASGTIDYPLTQDDKPAQPAVTHFRTLATLELPLRADRYPHSRYARVELVPVTGRTHQLRRHFAHLRHPLVGDTTHGVGAHNRLWREHCGCQRLLLACTRLAVAHPRTGAPLVIEAAPDASFEAAWAAGLALAVPAGPGEPMAHPLSPPSGTMAP
jgi:tRNA pseudouridine65 synthase